MSLTDVLVAGAHHDWDMVIEIHLEPAGDDPRAAPTGLLRGDDGRAVAFGCWLDLLGALTDAVDRQSTGRISP